MLNALTLALAMGAAIPSVAAPAYHPPINWSLDGHVGVNQDGGLALGVSFIPDTDLQLGIYVDVQKIEWNETTTENRFVFYEDFDSRRPPLASSTSTTARRDDLKWSAGVTWRFR